MTRCGLDVFLEHFPRKLRSRRIGVLCHAASISSAYGHIADILSSHPQCELGAIFGPQHGLFGQTQDNMVEWNGYRHPVLNVPVFSLYGQVRKPGREMLEGLDAFVVDLQDAGARPYTYIWTVKLCMEACAEAGLPVWLLDRPNPIAAVPADGPMLREDFFSFVGGAGIPLCHRLTIGELAMLLKQVYLPNTDLNVVWMEQWWRDSLFSETGLPWVLPSPNMPTLDTALVYPGMVLLEATNLSEGRGTTRPFEIFGAPYLEMEPFCRVLCEQELCGCVMRRHDFIPTFQKWEGQDCRGMQVHVTNPRFYNPVFTTVAVLRAALEASDGRFAFKPPPYEYEEHKMPFDILAGDSSLRTHLEAGRSLAGLREQWAEQQREFNSLWADIAHYPERIP